MARRRSTRSRGAGTATATPDPGAPEFSHGDEQPAAQPTTCWLCGRALGRRVEWHHPWPKSRGGRETVPVHPICHRTIHACFTNAELARMSAEATPLASDPKMQPFLSWIAGKPPDFHAPTRGRR